MVCRIRALGVGRGGWVENLVEDLQQLGVGVLVGAL